MDFNVTDFNVRLRTIRLREAVLAIVIGFILNVVLVVIFPPLGENENLIIMPLLCFVLLFFIWALRGTHGLDDDFSKLFERDNRRELFYVFLINLLFVFLVVALFANFDILYGFVYPEMEPLLDFTPTPFDPIYFIFEVISSVILAPILEELFFSDIPLVIFANKQTGYSKISFYDSKGAFVDDLASIEKSKWRKGANAEYYLSIILDDLDKKCPECGEMLVTKNNVIKCSACEYQED